jgi:hypothetical protein
MVMRYARGLKPYTLAGIRTRDLQFIYLWLSRGKYVAPTSGILFAKGLHAVASQRWFGSWFCSTRRKTAWFKTVKTVSISVQLNLQLGSELKPDFFFNFFWDRAEDVHKTRGTIFRLCDRYCECRLPRSRIGQRPEPRLSTLAIPVTIRDRTLTARPRFVPRSATWSTPGSRANGLTSQPRWRYQPLLWVVWIKVARFFLI